MYSVNVFVLYLSVVLVASTFTGCMCVQESGSVKDAVVSHVCGCTV